MLAPARGLWASEPNDDGAGEEWLTFDLDVPVVLSRVVISWGRCYAHHFRLVATCPSPKGGAPVERRIYEAGPTPATHTRKHRCP